MDEVVHRARMIGRGREDLLRDRTRFALLGIALVFRIGSGLQRERVEGGGLQVVWIPAIHLFHGLLVCESTRAVVALLPVREEGCRGRDVVAPPPTPAGVQPGSAATRSGT